MKRLNQFTRLAKEDQTLILNLCDKLPYKEVCATLAKPRAEGGLDLTTCPSALCKFYTRHHQESIAAEAIGQFASAIQINHQAFGEANFQALLSLVQTRLLEALRAGKPIDDLQKHFRTLERIQKCFLADEKFRYQNDRTQEAYLNHIKETGEGDGDDPDFIDHTVEKDPGAGYATVQDFADDPTQWERDVEFIQRVSGPEMIRLPTFMRTTARIVSKRAAENRTFDFLCDHKINPAFALAELQDKNPQSLLALQKKLDHAEIERQNKTKFPLTRPRKAPPFPQFPLISIRPIRKETPHEFHCRGRGDESDPNPVPQTSSRATSPT